MPDAPIHLDRTIDGLARNPALPPALIRRLFAHRKGFGSVAGRPDLSGDMIAGILAEDDFWLTHSLALNRTLPDRFRIALAGHADPGIRAAVATAAERWPHGLFERLADDGDPLVRRRLAENEHGPDDLRARLARDPDPSVRAALAQWWTRAPESVRRLLLTDADDEVRAAACATYYRRLPHPVPPADLVPALLADPVTRAGAVRHCSLDGDVAHRLATDPDPAVRKAVAAHPELRPPIRDLLATDGDPGVALAIFARRDTPEALRATVHTRLTAETPPSPPDASDEALMDWLSAEAARHELAGLRLPWVTADPLPHVDSPYACFRASAARSGDLPAWAVTALLADEESAVRTTMAVNSSIPVDSGTAERIDRDHRPQKRTRWRPADTLALPVEVLRRLAHDPDPRMRQLTPRDPELPSHLADALAADSDDGVRLAIASHPGLRPETLTRLLGDPAESVAEAAASHPALPIAEMERLLVLAGLSRAR
ncbi:hypothetical protein Afil01_33430 [Actinorhabdospora filicis]|uniref:Leucine rich repeat variant n=1 Tax=Actinorhabdospora filicis TaxID=1785913 RepID=A0A9W6SPU3_9ACTN|nr:hypothetical protein [Actinorhabdospora filicis]GLZ78536.1 hypothetical protein Afil01_33430 [Actinorhabdospora filicis]